MPIMRVESYEKIDYRTMRMLHAFVEVHFPLEPHISTPRLSWMHIGLFNSRSEIHRFKKAFRHASVEYGQAKRSQFIEKICLYLEEPPESKRELGVRMIEKDITFVDLCREVNILLESALALKELVSL